MTQPENNNPATDEMGFITHLLELRDRLLRMVLSVIVIFLCLFYFANDIYTYVSGPLLQYMPEGSQMIAIDVASPFLTPFKLSLVASIFIAMPYIFYQLWGFIAPGLYSHERRMAAPLVVVSSALFYSGMAFAYYVVFPLVFGFLTGAAPEGVSVMTDIARYLDFVLTMFFAFGAAFQVPVATIIVVWTGMTTPDKLLEKRPFVIVGAFVIGMLLTPPDFISQTLLAIPMWILFELGIVFARFYVPKEDEDEEDDDDDETENTIHPGTGVVATAVQPEVEDDIANEIHEDGVVENANDSGHKEYDPADDNDDDFKQLSDEEMDDEIDRIEAEMDAMMEEDDEEETDSETDSSDKKDKPE